VLLRYLMVDARNPLRIFVARGNAQRSSYKYDTCLRINSAQFSNSSDGRSLREVNPLDTEVRGLAKTTVVKNNEAPQFLSWLDGRANVETLGNLSVAEIDDRWGGGCPDYVERHGWYLHLYAEFLGISSFGRMDKFAAARAALDHCQKGYY
jgi:hypothetical protein